MNTPPFPVRTILTLICVLWLAVGSQPAEAATRTWINASGGAWETAANWSDGVVPDSADTVLINLDGTYTVTVSTAASFANLTVGGGTGTQSLRWTGGILTGDITIESGAEFRFAVSGFSSRLADGLLLNRGTIIWETAATQPWSLSAASIENTAGGLFDLQNDGGFSRHTGTPYLLNSGTLRKSTGTGYTEFNAGIAVTNRGTVQIQSGKLRFWDGFTSSSAFQIDSGAQLDLHGGTFHLEAGHSFNGSGDYGIFASGGPTIDGPLINDNFQLASGVLFITNQLTGTLQWTGGTLSGDLTIATGGVLNYAIGGFNSFLSSGSLTNHGTINWTAAGTQPWSLQSARIENAADGLIDLQRDGTFNRHTGTPSIVNHGTIRKSGGTGYTEFNPGIAITNRGSFHAQSGKLRFWDGFTSSSAFQIDTGAQLDLHGGTFHLETGHSFNGSGDYGIFASGGPTIDGPLINDNFQLASGTLYITNQLTGTIQWTGGTLSGDLIIATGGVLNYAIGGFNSYLSNGSLTNHGIINWTAAGTQPWSLQSARIVNATNGLIDLQRDGAFSRHTGEPAIVNHGTIRKSGGTGYTEFNPNIAVTNRGSILVQSGKFRFWDGFTSSSTFQIATGAQVDLHGGTFHLEAGHSFNGSGDYGIFSSGSPVIDGPLINDNFQLASGILDMTNVVTGSIQWTGGTLSGLVTIANGGVLNYGVTGFNSFHSSGVLTNHGIINWTSTASQPWSLQSARIENAGDGLIDLQRDGSFNLHSGSPSIANLGTLRKSGGAGTSTIAVPFHNSGTIEALSGRLSFTSTYSHTAGRLTFGIGGDTTFGSVSVGGDAPLVGALSAVLQGGYIPPVDQTFTVMTFGSRSGAFGDLTGLNVGSGRAFEPGYTATTLSLRAYQTNDVVIFTQPQPLTVVAGSPAEFGVTASGTGTLTYEWRHEGTALANTDNNRLVIPNAQPGNAGGYDVIISSTSGSATSHVAGLTVHVPPGIVAPPVNRSVGTGEAADFSVVATGIPAPSYQWYFNGAPIAGATAADYSVTAAMAGSVGTYSVVVSNAAGSVTNAVHLALVDLKMFAGLIIDAELGARFRVEFTTDINTPTTNWMDLGTVTLTNRPHFFFDLDSPGAPKRFYRAVPLPAP